MVVTVSSKGQIVLPAELRRKYGIKTGDKFVVVDLAGKIYLVPQVEDPIAALSGMLEDRPGGGTKELLEERRRDKEREEEKYQRWYGHRK